MSLADGLSMAGDGPSSMGVVVVEAEAAGRVAAVGTEGGGGAHCIGESWQRTWQRAATICAQGCRNCRDQQQE